MVEIILLIFFLVVTQKILCKKEFCSLFYFIPVDQGLSFIWTFIYLYFICISPVRLSREITLSWREGPIRQKLRWSSKGKQEGILYYDTLLSLSESGVIDVYTKLVEYKEPIC